MVTLALIVTACSGGGLDPVAFGGRASVSAAPATTTVDPTASGNTNVTFTSEGGSLGVNVTSATLTVPGGTATPVTVTLAAKTIPSGFVCPEASGNVSCSINSAATTPGTRTVQYAFSNTDLFSKAMTSFAGAKTFELRFGGNVAGSNTAWTSNATTFTVGATTDPTTPGDQLPPQPVLVVNNTDAQPFSRILSVTASAGLRPGQKIQSMQLRVTNSQGLVDDTSFVSNGTTATFSIDTAKFPDGNLTLQLIVTTDGSSGESAPRTVTIRNIVAPTMQITSPTVGQTVSTTLNAAVQLRRQNTAFTIPGQAGIDGGSPADTVLFNIKDYRGAVIASKRGTITSTNDGLYTANVSFDVTGPLFQNNVYSLEAVTRVLLSGETTSRPVSQETSFSTKNENNRPPSLLVQLPTTTGNTLMPRMGRNGGAYVEMTDDVQVKQLQVQLTCDSGACAGFGSYIYNVPIDAGGILARTIDLGSVLDGTPYVIDGQYVLRFTVTDSGSNTTIREVPVVISRAAADDQIAGLTGVTVETNPDPANTTAGQLNYSSATWALAGQNVNPLRVTTMTYRQRLRTIGVSDASTYSVDYVPANTEAPLALTMAFKEEGTYSVAYLVQDLVTGVTRFYNGAPVIVIKNPGAPAQ